MSDADKNRLLLRKATFVDLPKEVKSVILQSVANQDSENLSLYAEFFLNEKEELFRTALEFFRICKSERQSNDDCDIFADVNRVSNLISTLTNTVLYLKNLIITDAELTLEEDAYNSSSEKEVKHKLGHAYIDGGLLENKLKRFVVVTLYLRFQAEEAITAIDWEMSPTDITRTFLRDILKSLGCIKMGRPKKDKTQFIQNSFLRNILYEEDFLQVIKNCHCNDERFKKLALAIANCSVTDNDDL